MAPDEFATDRLGNLVDVERTDLGGQRGVEHDLKQQISELLFE